MLISKRTSIPLILLCSLLGFACSDIESVATGEILIAPEDVLFRELPRGMRVGTTTIEVRNVGEGRLPITGMRVEEIDDLDEIIIVDADDHQGERYLDPEQTEFVTLEWTARDAIADEARFIVGFHGIRHPDTN